MIRVVEEVPAPELYTLPGSRAPGRCRRLAARTDPGTSSFTTLGSGLTLALLPSLLLALDEPVSLRGALIGCRRRRSSRRGRPAAAGRAVRPRRRHDRRPGAAPPEPVADAVPRWISLGGVGLVLLVVGVTWEARRRNVETAGRYLTALR